MSDSSELNTPTTWSRHIFLTGQSGVGKSYLIQNVILDLQKDILVGGFATQFEVFSANEKTLYLSSVSTKSFSHKKKPVMKWQSGSISIHEDIFESYGVNLLQNAKKTHLIIMDELGRFEENCELFKSEVFRCLDGTIPILGVIRTLEHATWLDDVKSHPNVTVLQVNKENLTVIEKALRERFLR